MGDHGLGVTVGLGVAVGFGVFVGLGVAVAFGVAMGAAVGAGVEAAGVEGTVGSASSVIKGSSVFSVGSAVIGELSVGAAESIGPGICVCASPACSVASTGKAVSATAGFCEGTIGMSAETPLSGFFIKCAAVKIAAAAAMQAAAA